VCVCVCVCVRYFCSTLTKIELFRQMLLNVSNIKYTKIPPIKCQLEPPTEAKCSNLF